MSHNPHEIVEAYCSAWNEPDEDVRRKILETAWSDDGIYADPRFAVAGREELLRHIGNRQQQRPGAQIMLTSITDRHHHYLRFSWKLLAATGETLTEGIDFGELAADGRFQKIIGFFGPLAGNSE